MQLHVYVKLHAILRILFLLCMYDKYKNSYFHVYLSQNAAILFQTRLAVK